MPRKPLASWNRFVVAALACGIATPLTSCGTLQFGPSRVPTASRYRWSKLASPTKTAHARENLRNRARFNTDVLREFDKAGEAGLEHRGKGELPNLCVALSGGGIRSAAFGIGVLDALHALGARNTNDGGVLSRVNILSGTSGGAYAVTWYYMKQRAHPNPFDSQSLSTLYKHSTFCSIGCSLPGAIGDLMLSPVNMLLNGFLGWHWNTNFFGNSFYEHAIRKTFYGGEDPQFAAITHFLRHPKKSDPQLPYPIITATARLDEDMSHSDALAALTVFEFTPLIWGSDAYRSRAESFRPQRIDGNFKLARAVAISGSAPDSTEVPSGASQRVFASALNEDIGQYIPNFAVHYSPLQRAGFYILPFPFYFLSHQYARDRDGARIYLSDGGHRENLAAFPLVRRMCRQILIVDATYDPDYKFDDYFRFKHTIERETGARVLLYPDELASGKRQDIESLDPSPTAPSDPSSPADDSFPHFKKSDPVLEGKIGTFPILDRAGQVEPSHIDLLYVKMSVDSEQIAKLPRGQSPAADRASEETLPGSPCGGNCDALIQHTQSSKSHHCDVEPFEPCAFPQLSTTWQGFTKSQFKAYVELGYYLTRHYIGWNPKSSQLVRKRR